MPRHRVAAVALGGGIRCRRHRSRSRRVSRRVEAGWVLLLEWPGVPVHRPRLWNFGTDCAGISMATMSSYEYDDGAPTFTDISLFSISTPRRTLICRRLLVTRFRAWAQPPRGPAPTRRKAAPARSRRRRQLTYPWARATRCKLGIQRFIYQGFQVQNRAFPRPWRPHRSMASGLRGEHRILDQRTQPRAGQSPQAWRTIHRPCLACR
ncbi:hypothetical protein SAMN04489742_1681 [Arthrobacter crystallopoietes]|uniref:Uncharacterized protein n=1 Tax=Crystallibacter crystallopoietes TaxID=37928 RepID=A0A1H1C0U6_9MICC|nr:hypothetical protein SAMN04489742_1681 [Arthrobacter crystallopoietes]